MSDRVIVWAGQIPLETDVLRTNKFAMIGLAKLTAAMLGTGTIVNGLSCVPTSPASLSVSVNPGEIYSLVNVDGTAYSSVAADTAHSIMKQGILMDAATLNCPAPGTAGQSINYLIEAQYQDVDGDNTVLPYYNASNPSQAWSGPNNSNSPQSTTRKGIVSLVAKAGTAAPTGTQATPAPDSGYIGLWVVTVANGQTTITTGNITQAANAPFLPSDLLHAVQNSSLVVGTDTGSTNTCVVSYTPAVAALIDGMVLWFKAKAANTGAVTLNVNGLGAQSVVGGAHNALQGGEIIANGKCQVVWNATLNAFVLIECTGAALQVAPATKSQHAPQMAQVAGVVGHMRNLQMSVTAASATATLTADEIIVETALGGIRYCLPSFNKSINLAATGVGGMDVGAAPTSGFVALYAIYNPTSGSSGLLATNATSAVAPNVYGGANMPAGYTASALISVWPTNGSGQFGVGYQADRKISIPITSVLSSSVIQAAFTALSIAAAVPMNAKACTGEIGLSSTSTTTIGISLAANAAPLAQQNCTTGGATSFTGNFKIENIITPQTLYYANSNTAGTPTFSVYVSSYEI
ncbi:hypothetical protein [Ralstonia wenshanensis]|uniref:hypothetical protein n=1 Tax=Ralstonia wenshanensis TaxID=2842456 RepID=UPI003D97B8D4